MSLQDVTAIDGTKIDVAGSRGVSGDSHVGRMVTGIVITSIFTLGGASLFLLMHGKDLVIPEGSGAWLLRSIRNSLSWQLANVRNYGPEMPTGHLFLPGLAEVIYESRTA